MIINYAHRGASEYAPENTLGTDGALVCTKEGVVQFRLCRRLMKSWKG